MLGSTRRSLIAIAWLLYVARLPAGELTPNDREFHIPREDSNTTRPVTSMDLLTIRQMGGDSGRGLSVSPDGRHVAFEVHQADLDSNSYRVGWFVAPTSSGSPPIHVGDGGDPKLFRTSSDDGTTTGTWVTAQPKWSLDGQWILYRRSVGREVQIWTSRRDGSVQKQLTYNDADVADFSWAEDGLKLFFTVGARRSVSREAARLANERGHLFDMENPWSTLLGKPTQRRYELTGGKPQLWVYEWETEKERLATSAERAEYERLDESEVDWVVRRDAHVAAQGDNSAAIAWAEPADPSRRGVAPPLTLHASTSGKESDSLRCSHPECTGMLNGLMGGYTTIEGGLSWDESDQEVYFVRYEGTGYHRITLYAWHVRDNELRRVLSTDDWISGCSRVGESAICFRQTPTHPRTVVAIDLRSGKAKTLVDANPEFRRLILGEVRHLEFDDTHGHSVYGKLVLPVNYEPNTRYPLILVGYRPKLTVPGGTGNEYPVHAFAANGFAVYVYNVYDNYEATAALSDWYEVSAMRWNTELKNLTEALSMMEAVIRRLDKEQVVDPSRVGITGFSTGATYAAYALINSDLFSVASTSSVQFEPIGYYLSPSGSGWRAHLRRIGFGPSGGPYDRNWKNVSLSRNVEAVSAPILINASDNEYHPAMQTATAFIEAGKPFELYVHPDEFHIKWYPKHRYHIYERNLDWFNFWLKGEGDSNKMKVEQYERWRQLRQQHTTNFENAGKDYTLPLLFDKRDAAH